MRLGARLAAAAIVVASITACGGAAGTPLTPGGAQPPGPAIPSPSTNATLVPTTFTLAGATHASSQRGPQYVGAGTRSVTITLVSVNGAPPPTGPTATAHDNVTLSGCPCVLPGPNVPSGTDVFTVATYDGTYSGGVQSGNLLSAATTIAETISIGGANHITLTLAGVPVSTRVAPASPYSTPNGSGGFNMPDQGPHTFVAETLDADGNVIVGPGAPRFNIGTPSGTLAGVTTSPTTTTISAPDSFTVTPPTTYSPGTASFTVTPTFVGQATNGCAQPGANCAAIMVTVDMTRITEYPVPTTSAGPLGIASGPDGNLWFTEYNAGKIGKITTAGAITEFPIPTSPANPEGITKGPDGNLWFTEWSGNNISKITTAGAITEFPVPTTGPFPFGIATGPNGNLWFTEFFGIGKITTAGMITEFPLPTSAANPDGITAGPDGNLWFTETTANKIGKITTTGVITEFPLPTSGAYPVSITAGPDGNLWFTEDNGNNIGKITTAGTITEFPLPTSSAGPADITAGPDGNLWFTELSGNKIGKITP